VPGLGDVGICSPEELVAAVWAAARFRRFRDKPRGVRLICEGALTFLTGENTSLKVARTSSGGDRDSTS
jgi:hypothetical protein